MAVCYCSKQETPDLVDNVGKAETKVCKVLRRQG